MTALPSPVPATTGPVPDLSAQRGETQSTAPRADTANGAEPGTGDAIHPPRPSRQYGLDVLRVLAICGVVAIHVIGLILGKDDLRGTATWWIAVAIDIGAIWTVPVFVMVSGALVLAPRVHAAGPVAFYRKRFVRIIPAMVVWHLVYIVLVRMVMRGEDLRLVVLARQVIDAKIFTALYFLWLIAGLYAIAPVLAAFLGQGGRRRALSTAAVALGWTLVAFMISGFASLYGFPRPIQLGAWTMWWPYVGYFLAGWALHRIVLSGRATALVAAVGGLLLAEGIWQWGVRPRYATLQLMFPISYLGATVAIVSICLFLVAVSLGARWTPGPRVSRALVRLSEASFGVFLVHLLILEVLRLVVPAVDAGRSLPVMLAAYAVVLITSFAVSLGASKVPYVRAVF